MTTTEEVEVIKVAGCRRTHTISLYYKCRHCRYHHHHGGGNITETDYNIESYLGNRGSHCCKNDTPINLHLTNVNLDELQTKIQKQMSLKRYGFFEIKI